jgi:hypothetical protein
MEEPDATSAPQSQGDDTPMGRLNAYRSAVVGLSQDLARLQTHAEGFKLSGAASQTRNVLQRLKNDRFQVAVVGEFNRGKSTVINALLGAPILPMDILPCTATVNRVTYSQDKRAVIEFRDGAIEEVPYDSLKDYITKLSQESEERALSIREATIFYPSQYCANDVDVVDTPGLNEDQSMTDVTLSVLPHCDAAIMVIMANAPFSQYEQEFLRDHLLVSDVGRVIFIVNAIDAIDSEDRPRLLQTIEQRIKSLVMDRLATHLGKDSEEYKLKEARLGEVKVIGLSARKAMRAKQAGDMNALEESGFLEFERRLQVLLTEERAAIRLQIPIGRAINGSREIAESIRLRDAALQMNAAEFEAAADEAEAKIKAVRAEWTRKRHELEQAERNTAQLAKALAVDFVQDLRDQTLQVIDTIPINAEDLKGDNRKSLQERLTEERGKRRNDLVAVYQAKLETIVTGQIAGEMDRLEQFEAELGSLMDRIDQRFSDLSQVNLSRPAEGVMGALAVFIGFGGLWSGYKVAGLKGAAAGGAAGIGGAFAAGAILAVLGAPITFPVIIAVGVLSIFTGEWAAKLLFGGEAEKHFRQRARQAALDEIDKLGVEQVADQLAMAASTAFRAFKNQVIETSESKLADSTSTLQALREEYVQKGAENDADRRRVAEISSEIEQIAIRATGLAGRFGLGGSADHVG